MKMRHAISATLALSALVAASDASAITRIETRGQSCGAIQRTLNLEGAAILRYRSKNKTGLPIYDRYVANRSACTFGEVTERATVPTRDTARCPVLKCYRPDYDDNRLLMRPRFGMDD